MYRTHNNGELRLTNVNEEVELVGWVSKTRRLGGLTFIDLRDTTGIIQLIVNDNVEIPDVRNEYVINVKGVVRKKDNPNPKLKTGEVEVEVKSISVLSKAITTPFIIADDTDALEDTRLQYRYLDIRRPIVQSRLRTKAQIMKITRDYFDSLGFTEIETPILNLATPEGARDYLVPSRVRNGSFYALPQSPQLFKQLLMIGGMERYYQIARCFRDEDLRADRQPEFTQIDVETSFLSQDEILEMTEKLLKRYFKEILNYDIQLPLRRMKFWDAMDNYGSDKPDTRYDLRLHDVTAIMKKTSFEAFASTPYIKAIVVPNYADKASRKVLDNLISEAKKFKVNGLSAFKYIGGKLESSFLKFMDEDTQKELIETLGLKENDYVLVGAHAERRAVCFALGAIRTKLAKELGLIKDGTYDLLWVIDFPMFDAVDGQPGVYSAEHHPFTRPRDEDLPLLDTDPEAVLAYAYDIVINGYEAGGGTLRIYDHDTQWKIFRLLGLSEEDVAKKFGWFVDAFRYGVPPHGGFALGLDRLTMILTGTDNIRDVIAFPKNLQAGDPMSHAPARVSKEQLDVLGIELREDLR